MCESGVVEGMHNIDALLGDFYTLICESGLDLSMLNGCKDLEQYFRLRAEYAKEKDWGIPILDGSRESLIRWVNFYFPNDEESALEFLLGVNKYLFKNSVESYGSLEVDPFDLYYLWNRGLIVSPSFSELMRRYRYLHHSVAEQVVYLNIGDSVMRIIIGYLEGVSFDEFRGIFLLRFFIPNDSRGLGFVATDLPRVCVEISRLMIRTDIDDSSLPIYTIRDLVSLGKIMKSFSEGRKTLVFAEMNKKFAEILGMQIVSPLNIPGVNLAIF